MGNSISNSCQTAWLTSCIKAVCTHCPAEFSYHRSRPTSSLKHHMQAAAALAATAVAAAAFTPVI